MASVRQSFTKREHFLQSTVVDQTVFHMENMELGKTWLLLRAQSIIDLPALILKERYAMFHKVRSESRCALRLRKEDLVQARIDARRHHFQNLYIIEQRIPERRYAECVCE
jgi:hypothetical protein